MRIFMTIAMLVFLSSELIAQESNVNYDADSLQISGVWKPEKFWKKSSDQVLKLQVSNQGQTPANVFFTVAFFHEGKRVEAAEVKLIVDAGKKAKGRSKGLVFKPDYSQYEFTGGQDYPPNWEVEDLVNQR